MKKTTNKTKNAMALPFRELISLKATFIVLVLIMTIEILTDREEEWFGLSAGNTGATLRAPTCTSYQI